MRISGNITATRVLSGSFRDDLDKAHKECLRLYGPGMFHYNDSSKRDGGVEWYYDYAEKFEYARADNPANCLIMPEGVDPAEFVEAVRLGRVTMCNLAAVKAIDPMGSNIHYVPIDPNDENAVQKCRAINTLEQFLDLHGAATAR